MCGSGGGAGCGHVSSVRTAAAREYAEPNLTQLTVGPVSGSVVPVAPPWWSASGELGAGNAAQASSVGVGFTHTDVRREVNYGVLTVGVHGEAPEPTGASPSDDEEEDEGAAGPTSAASLDFDGQGGGPIEAGEVAIVQYKVTQI